MTFITYLKPNSFTTRATTADVDYLENQCAENPIGQATCDYQEYENQDIGFPDLQITVANQAEVSKNHLKIKSYKRLNVLELICNFQTCLSITYFIT